MTQAPTCEWKGKSGRVYLYWIHPIGQVFEPVPGNYIFAKATAPGHWVPVYIGETKDLSERFDDHHKMPCIEERGATHIHVHVNNEEADLIANYNPPCNG